MSWVKAIQTAVAATGSATILITAAPVLGAAGTLSAGGYLAATIIGASAAVKDKLDNDKEKGDK